MSQTGRKYERGIALPMTALMILVLFAMAALGIDLGILYTARTSAQNVADAAALAGAFTFLNPTALQPATAKNAAIEQYGANGSAYKTDSTLDSDERGCGVSKRGG